MKFKFYALMLLLIIPIEVSAKVEEASKEQLMNDADSLFNLGEYEKARETYKQVYIEDGDAIADAQIEKCDQCMSLIKAAMTDVINGNYEDAIKSYLEVLKINPDDKKVPQQILDCRKRQYEPNLKHAQQSYREGKYQESKFALGEYFSLTGLTDNELADNIKNCINLSNEAKKAKDNGDYEAALSIYNRILEINPGDVNSANERADIYRVTQKKETITKTIYVQQPEKPNKKPRKKLINGIHDISWILGVNSGVICGDYFGVYTEVKLGNPSGIGFEFGYGPGLDSEHLYNNNWTFGVKGYIKGWFLSTNYGTTLPIYGKKLTEGINSDGSIIKEGARDYGRYGFDFLIGYDKSFNWFHFEIGAGIIIPTKNTKILPAWTIGIGIDILKLIK